jgi:hypothetical protein
MTLPLKTETKTCSTGMLRYEAMLAETASRSIAVIASDEAGNVIQTVEYVMGGKVYAGEGDGGMGAGVSGM